MAAGTTTAIGSRDVDLYVLGEPITGRLSLTIGQDAQVVAGPLAAAQKFLLVLLTRKGSDALDAEHGTEFLYQAYAGRLRSQADATLALSDAIQDALSQLEGYRRADSDDDEEVARVEIDSVAVLVDSLEASLTLTTLAGAAVTIILPVALVVG